MFYTYIHRTADNGRLFYIGKGKGSRSTCRHKRSNHWNSVVNKHGGFQAEIVGLFETEQEAFAHERFLIASFRTFGARLANKTDGGDGLSGYKHSQEMRLRLSAMHKGKVMSEESRRRMSESRKGKPVPALRGPRGPMSEETKQRMRKPKSGQARHNMRAARAGQEVSVVCCTTSVQFRSVAAAVDWLVQDGFEKASKSAVTECCQGKRKTAYGYKWIYTKEAK
jgi:hypothetical protein